MPAFGKRFLEYFLSQIIPSVLFTFLFTHRILAQTLPACIIVISVCIIFNLIYLYRCLNGYLYSFDDYKAYFKVNLSVFTAFFIMNITLAIVNFEPLYTYLFLPYKLFTFCGLSKILSAVIINVFLFLYILIIPYFYSNKKNYYVDDEDDTELLKKFDDYEDMDYFNK